MRAGWAIGWIVGFGCWAATPLAWAQAPADGAATPLPAGGEGAPADGTLSTGAAVHFHLDRAGVSVPHYTLVLHPDGSGEYTAERVTKDPESSAETHQQVEQAIAIRPATAAKIFAAAHKLHQFNVSCGSKAKNIADTGAKTLSYSGPEGKGSCAYNYSDNKAVTEMTDTLVAVAFTLEEGSRLEFKHRFDRLGLDAEMETLVKANEQGYAQEMLAIAPTLRSLAGDTELLDRVRLRAGRLLEQASSGR